MFQSVPSKETLATEDSSKVSGIFGGEFGESLFGEDKKDDKEEVEEEEEEEEPKTGAPEGIKKKTIAVGDSLPYGIRLHYGTAENIVRMSDIGVKKRILLLGVIGSFTPYCWNRHLFRVLQKSRYFEERFIDYICCVSTNDPPTQRAWGSYLGCDETVLMFADTTTRFTKAIGMDVVIPWLDNRIRSKRYLIYAEDMVVLKMIVAPKDGPRLKWRCEHLRQEEEMGDEDDESSESYSWNVH